jgi:beta-lactamase class D
VVWYYQELARRVGADTMKFWLDKVSYGNADTSGGIDQFWLTGNLRISPIEQILFLQKLKSEQLPFSKNTITIVKDIMIQERSESLINRKTTNTNMREQSSATAIVTGDIPLNSKSDSVIATVDPIIEQSQKNASTLVLSEKDYIIRWKTGWGNQDGKDIGWIVGYMEKGADVYYFANCIEAEVGKTISQENFLNARMEILQTILAEYKLN